MGALRALGVIRLQQKLALDGRVDVSAFERSEGVSLLQDPVHVLDQIDWYLGNSALEKFPGAFELAAGNLARQLLEQSLFIIAFYSGCPQNRYLNRQRKLRTIGSILDGLKKPGARGEDLFRAARRRGSRVRKFANLRRRLDAWRSLLNEPSHYRKPDLKRQLTRERLEEIRDAMRATFDGHDAYLILAAVNDLCSNGSVRALLGPEPECVPVLAGVSIARIRDIAVAGGTLGLSAPRMPIRAVSPDRDVPLRHWRALVVVTNRPLPRIHIE